MAESFDAVVVGAGPAGSAAALRLAEDGHEVCLLERGPFPGAKNMYGGVVYGRILDGLVPRWWEEAPIQRWVVRRSTMVLGEGESVSFDVRAQDWGHPPHNGATAYRSDFDRWLAGRAVAAGARLVTSTTATGLLGSADGRVAGVRTDRPGGELRSRVLIACDGVNSFLAKEAGLFHATEPDHYSLGVKEVLSLPRREIERRFGVRGRDGADIEILDGTCEVAGGAFLYTNLDTIAVGLVLHLPALRCSRKRPEQLLAELKAHPSVAPLVEGGEIVEYSAHLIPEGGSETIPRLGRSGMLVAGDAASLCLAAGIWLEGVNFAIGSGAVAAEIGSDALKGGSAGEQMPRRYRERLERSFVLADHRKLGRVPALLMSDRVQRRYPRLLCGVGRGLFTVTNPKPKAGLWSLMRRESRAAGVGLRDLARDAWAGLRSFG